MWDWLFSPGSPWLDVYLQRQLLLKFLSCRICLKGKLRATWFLNCWLCANSTCSKLHIWWWQALGPGFTQYAEPVFLRCINLIRTHEVAKVWLPLLNVHIVRSLVLVLGLLMLNISDLRWLHFRAQVNWQVEGQTFSKLLHFRKWSPHLSALLTFLTSLSRVTYATGFGYRAILREQVWTMTKSSLSVPWIYYQVLLRGLAAVLRAWYGSLYIIVCFNCPVSNRVEWTALFCFHQIIMLCEWSSLCWLHGCLTQVSRSDLRDLLLQCCADEAPDVRQSALALLGDLVKVLNYTIYSSLWYLHFEYFALCTNFFVLVICFPLHKYGVWSWAGLCSAPATPTSRVSKSGS